jgi:hypothetical protein
MKKLFPILTLIICFSLLVSSCNLPLGGSSPSATAPIEDVVGTAAAQTVQALSTQIAQTAQPPQNPTHTLAPDVPTNTVEVLAPSDTPEPTLTRTLASPTATMGPLDKLGKVDDITYADGTVVTPGTTFTKTWRLTNAGTTTWGTGYAVVFFSGDAMSSPASVPITANVPPNGTVDISVALTAPSTAKSYTGYYKIRNAGGALFGFGVNADQAFWVKITVGSSSTSSGVFAVTSVDISVSPSSKTSTSCPTGIKFTWTADIKVNKAGTITYHWDRSDGTSGDSKDLVFTEAGTATVTDTWKEDSTWVATNTFNPWERIYIDDPNHQSFPKAKAKLIVHKLSTLT